MKTYWDLTEQERAALTDEDVEKYRKVELMEQGVVEVPLPPEPQVTDPTLQKTRVYCLSYKGKHSWSETSAFCFESMEQAEAFIAMKPKDISKDYSCGDGFPFLSPIREMQVTPKDVYREEDIMRVKGQLAANKQAREEYDNAKNEATKARDKASEVLNKLYEDWAECRQKLRYLQRIWDTFREYVKLAEGNRDTAMRFLTKNFSPEQIKESRDWDLWLDAEKTVPIPPVVKESEEEPETEGGGNSND